MQSCWLRLSSKSNGPRPKSSGRTLSAGQQISPASSALALHRASCLRPDPRGPCRPPIRPKSRSQTPRPARRAPPLHLGGEGGLVMPAQLRVRPISRIIRAQDVLRLSDHPVEPFARRALGLFLELTARLEASKHPAVFVGEAFAMIFCRIGPQ